MGYISQKMVEWRFNNPYKFLRQQLKKYGVTVDADYVAAGLCERP
jgi:hypothetical protein